MVVLLLLPLEWTRVNCTAACVGARSRSRAVDVGVQLCLVYTSEPRQQTELMVVKRD